MFVFGRAVEISGGVETHPDLLLSDQRRDSEAGLVVLAAVFLSPAII